MSQPTGELSTTLVGHETDDLLSTKPLLIRPVTPRFYVVGDTSTLAAVVNNNTGADQDVTRAESCQGRDLQRQHRTHGEDRGQCSHPLQWSIEVQDVSAVDATFFVNTADNKYTDAAKSTVGQGDDQTLPVLRYEAPQTVGTGGAIGPEGGDRTEGIALSPRLKITQGVLDIRLIDRWQPVLLRHSICLKIYRVNLPNTISRFLPNLMTYRALKQLGLDTPELRDHP